LETICVHIFNCAITLHRKFSFCVKNIINKCVLVKRLIDPLRQECYFFTVFDISLDCLKTTTQWNVSQLEQPNKRRIVTQIKDVVCIYEVVGVFAEMINPHNNMPIRPTWQALSWFPHIWLLFIELWAFSIKGSEDLGGFLRIRTFVIIQNALYQQFRVQKHKTMWISRIQKLLHM